MGIFISVCRESASCHPGCNTCYELCPVDLFSRQGEEIVIREENEDECTLCDLCTDGCPEKLITIVKHY
ncbi:MAG: ferredoxin [Candidatus Tectomicrobia bacterium]|uniref:Ferredoxin n=1 Tax=Tectimicrobiota bacterium TaxID=2528274 RepID=A0A932CMM8_UNCTE|nr:ferredoxin [Candidatus Tectomicrobia bacterium]